MVNPEAMPFDAALEQMRGNPTFRDALIEVGDTVEMAKKILLQNRVRDFTAADVLALTRMVMEREQLLRDRSEGNDERGV